MHTCTKCSKPIRVYKIPVGRILDNNEPDQDLCADCVDDHIFTPLRTQRNELIQSLSENDRWMRLVLSIIQDEYKTVKPHTFDCSCGRRFLYYLERCEHLSQFTDHTPDDETPAVHVRTRRAGPARSNNTQLVSKDINL